MMATLQYRAIQQWVFYSLLFLLAFAPAGILAQPDTDDIDRNLSAIDELLDRARRSHSDAEIETLANQSMRMAKSARYESGLVRASVLLGEVSIRQGNTEKALRHYLEAEDRAKASGNNIVLPGIYEAMGDLFFSQKLYDNASRYFTESLASDLENPERLEKAADAFLYGMHYDSAEFYYKILISKYKQDGNNPHLVQIYQKLASAYNESGNYGKTLLYYLRIEDIISRFGRPFEKGQLYNNLGKVYATLGDYQKALEYFKKTEIQCGHAALVGQSCESMEVLYTNLGIALHNSGNTKEGLQYLFKARAILAGRNDQIALSSLEHIIATVYANSNDHYNALTHNDAAIQYAKVTGQSDVLTRAYRTASRVYQDLYDYEKAFTYYTLYLSLSDSARIEDQRRQMMLAERSSQLRSAEGEIKFLLAQQEIKERDLQQARDDQDKLEKSNTILAAEAAKTELEVALLQKQKEVNQATLREKTALALQAEQKLRLAAQTLDSEKQNAVILQLRQQEAIDEAERLAGDREVELLRREKEVVELKLNANAEFQRNTYIIGGLGGIMLLILGISWWYARRTGRRLRLQNQKIEAQKDQIESERKKSDRLLLNILPDQIAHELKTRGYADPKLYSSATVVFTDFVNFTRLSENLPPEQIISELDECFAAFDEIIDRNGLEKIKTIGDAFMCAGGLPVTNTTHPRDAVQAAIEMMDWLNKRNITRPEAVYREMRIGIHTGPVVAGVIGKNKFAYDIWGDAVNLASRLEEQSESGRINISESTHAEVKDEFNCIWRGEREVHNKGLVGMYFVGE